MAVEFEQSDEGLSFPRQRRLSQPGDELPVEFNWLQFSFQSDQPANDFDVLMGYQVFLGRNPENSGVIADAKAGTVLNFLRACLTSNEFRDNVFLPLTENRTIRHEQSTPGPNAGQRNWIQRQIELDDDARIGFQNVRTWREFFEILSRLAEFPRIEPLQVIDPVKVNPPEPATEFVMLTIDSPDADTILRPGNQIHGQGWVIAPTDITEIKVELDDEFLTYAAYGLPRPDVARNFPHYRQADHCGFTFVVDIPETLDSNSTHLMRIVAHTQGGAHGEAIVSFSQRTSPQNPDAFAIRLEVGEASIDASGHLRITGYAVARHELNSILAFVGEQELPPPHMGLTRQDVASMYPDYINAARSGFALAHAIDGFDFKPTMLRVIVTDVRGNERQVIVPLTLPEITLPAAEGVGEGFLFSCDVAKLSTNGHITVSGWALANTGVSAIEIFLNDMKLGEAELGGLRRDVAEHHGDMPNAEQSGFRFERSSGIEIEAGEHRIDLHLIAGDGSTKTVHIEVTAEEQRLDAIAVPGSLRLEIDRPQLSGDNQAPVMQGAMTIAGWAVSRAGIASVDIYSGDTHLGAAYLGMRREDIAAAFPDYPGSLLAGYALVMPPGALQSGEHQIRITARDHDQQAISRSFALRVEEDFELPNGLGIASRVSAPEAELAALLLSKHDYWPGFRIIIVAIDGTPNTCDAVIDTVTSLITQSYDHWSASVFFPNAAALANAKSKKSKLIEFTQGLPETQILLTSSRVAPPPQGNPQMVMRLRAGDILGANALQEFAIASATDREASFIYGDDLRTDWGRQRQASFVKPCFSPQLLLSMNYIGRAWCASESLLQRAKLTLSSIAGLSDWDIVLKLTEAVDSAIANVPHVLLAEGEEEDSQQDRHNALRGAIVRRQWRASIVQNDFPGVMRVVRKSARVKISVIMPTCAARDLVRTAINSIRATQGIHRVEIVIVDNIPDPDSDTKAWLKKNADVVVPMTDSFNWSAFNNAGARSASGEYLLFLNDDVEATEEGWLDALLEYVSDDSVGVVGARLLYPDGKIQHAGQYLAGGHARHAFRFAEGNDAGPFGLACAAREMMSVTGACMMIRREVFDELEGFDEAHSIVNNDLDFCLRVNDVGLSVIYTPHAKLIHHELASRARIDDRYDIGRFEAMHRLTFLRGDPWRSPSLLAESDHYAPDTEPLVVLRAGNPMQPREEVKRILAVKLDHIGDYLTSLPAMRSLKARFPNAELHLLAPPATAMLARNEPVVDEVIEFSLFHARSGDGKRDVAEAEFAALEAKLEAKHYDIAIDLRVQPETRHVLRFTGAATLAGFDTNGRFPWLDVALEWEGDTRLVPKRAHISERLLQLTAVLESACMRDTAPPVPPPLSPYDVPTLASLPSSFLEKKLVCVHPGVGNPVRQWPSMHYAGLIDLLIADSDVNVLLIGAAEEQGITEDVLRHVRSRGRVISLAGQVKLSELGDVMRACVLFVGNNSGPKHLAGALGVPTIGIHSSVIDPAEWAPIGESAIALKRQMSCGPCYLEFMSDCPRGLACLTGIRPADVYEHCRVLLAAVPQRI